MEPNKDVKPNELEQPSVLPQNDPTNLDIEPTTQKLPVAEAPLDIADEPIEPKPYVITPNSKMKEADMAVNPIAAANAPENSAPFMATQVADAPTASTAIVSAPAASGSGAVSGDSVAFGFGGVVPSKAQKRWTKKKWGILLGGAFAVLSLLAGGVYAFYLPTTPGAVWNTALPRTGAGLDKVVQSATDQKKLDALKTSKITGKLTADMADGTYSGNFTTTFDANTLDSGLDVTLSSAGKAQKLNAKFQTQKPQNSLYPDAYFKLSGLTSLGLDSLVPGISQYDAKWIVIKSDTFKQYAENVVPAGTTTDTQVTSADIAEVARAASTTTKDYVFTTAPDKAVLEQKSFVGKETIDGMKVYHYKVGVNTAHSEEYCKALASSVISTNAYKKLSGANADEIAQAKKSANDDCAQSVKDGLKDNRTYDLWIDSKYKLVYKVRVTDTTDAKSYTEVGQVYKGGDQLSLFLKSHEDKAKMDLNSTLETNLNTNNTTATFSAKSSDKTSPYSLTAEITATESNQPVTITPPTNAIPIEDVLKKLGFDVPASGGAAPATGGIQAKAQDTERQTDIAALRSHLEAYYAENGSYPLLTQLNDPAWRAANLKGLDNAALRDPNGSADMLAATVSATQYGYSTTGCTTGKGCLAYVLTAQLSDSSKYTKQSLN